MISRKQLLTLAMLTLMWGINWPMMKFSLRELSPLYFRALTMTAGSLFLYSWYRAQGLRMLPQGAEWRSVISLGIPNMLGWHTVSILGVRNWPRAVRPSWASPCRSGRCCWARFSWASI